MYFHIYDFFGVVDAEQKMKTLVTSLEEAGITTAVIGTMSGEPAVEFQTEKNLSFDEMRKFEKLAEKMRPLGISITSDSLSSLDENL